MYSIDIIIEKKHRWNFKELLTNRNLDYIEWFVEFSSERSIISCDVHTREHVTEIVRFLKDNSPGSRLVLPNGSNINPAKEEFDRIVELILKKISRER